MRNIPIGVTRDVDQHVDRILRDLKGLKPPLSINAVRELLSLDLAYYSANDTSAVGGMVHRMRIAKHQVIQRPALVLDAIRKLDLKALWLPDQRRILIDSDLPTPKQRWAAGHEIVHSVLPWHGAFTHGDRLGTLHTSCHQAIEAEANYGASRLLFMGAMFDEQAREFGHDFDAVKKLSKTFGNSMASTLWRHVINSRDAVLGAMSDCSFDAFPVRASVRHLFCSQAFAEQFGAPSAEEWATIIANTASRRSGPCGEKEHPICSRTGERRGFLVSCFNNQHGILTIASARVAGS